MGVRSESRLETYLKEIFDRFSISERNRSILIGRISKNKTYHELAVQHDVSLERIREIVIRFWSRVAYRLTVFNRCYEDENKKAVSELRRIGLYNPEKIGDLLKRKYVRNITEYNFSVRAFKCLWYSGIKTIDQLTERTEEDLLKIRNLGRKSIQEIKDLLAEYGYSLNLNKKQR